MKTYSSSQIDEIGSIALGYSIGYLAPGLPIYQAILSITDAPITSGSILNFDLNGRNNKRSSYFLTNELKYRNNGSRN